MTRKVALLGAYDRFNYGDLLFPIVAKNEMALHSPQTQTAVHALIDSDLSRYGALSTRSLKSLYLPDALHEGDVVIYSGGGTVGVDWNYMHSNLLGHTGNLALYYLKRIAGEAVANSLSRRYFGARSPFPWVAAPEDFPVRVKVAYNAVGGSEFSHLAPETQARTLERLSKASFLSVRDAETRRLFAPVEDSVAVALAPDSAVLMSEQFSVAWLQKQAGGGLNTLLDDGPFVCFQSNIDYARRNADRIVTVLESIYEQHGLRALLLPIGRYAGLDDPAALRQIRPRLRTPSHIISDDASIWEIMLVIARARLFLGTSLHGHITSQSFAVPHLGLSDVPCKLDYYLNTWDIPEQARCVRLDEVSVQMEKVLAVCDAVRQKKRTELMDASLANFGKLARASELDWL